MGISGDIAWEIAQLRKEGFEVPDISVELSGEESQALLRMANTSERSADAMEGIHQMLQAILETQVKGSPEIPSDNKPVNWLGVVTMIVGVVAIVLAIVL